MQWMKSFLAQNPQAKLREVSQDSEEVEVDVGKQPIPYHSFIASIESEFLGKSVSEVVSEPCLIFPHFRPRRFPCVRQNP